MRNWNSPAAVSDSANAPNNSGGQWLGLDCSAYSRWDPSETTGARCAYGMPLRPKGLACLMAHGRICGICGRRLLPSQKGRLVLAREARSTLLVSLPILRPSRTMSLRRCTSPHRTLLYARRQGYQCPVSVYPRCHAGVSVMLQESPARVCLRFKQ
jgi:hypothetical protein